jgi:HAMP domain-containing protein
MTSRILAALLVLTGGLLLGALLPLGFAMAGQYERDYRTETLGLAHTLSAAAEEKIVDHENSTMLTRTLAALRAENDGGQAMTVAVTDDDGDVVEGRDTGLYAPARAAPALRGHAQVTRTGGRLLAVVPITGHTGRVAGTVLLSRPIDPLQDRIMRLWTVLATVAVAAVTAAVILAVALAGWAGRPLRHLEAAAEALGTGDLTARADPPKKPAASLNASTSWPPAWRASSTTTGPCSPTSPTSSVLRSPPCGSAWNSSPPIRRVPTPQRSTARSTS